MYWMEDPETEARLFLCSSPLRFRFLPISGIDPCRLSLSYSRSSPPGCAWSQRSGDPVTMVLGSTPPCPRVCRNRYSRARSTNSCAGCGVRLIASVTCLYSACSISPGLLACLGQVRLVTLLLYLCRLGVYCTRSGYLLVWTRYCGGSEVLGGRWRSEPQASDRVTRRLPSLGPKQSFI